MHRNLFYLFVLIQILILTSCGASSTKSNSDLLNDVETTDKDHVDHFEKDPDNSDFEEIEDNTDNNDTSDNETADTGHDDHASDDSDIYISPCNPNPCTEKHKTVCREIYGVFSNEHIISKCFCEQGWAGNKCSMCQKGYYGKNCDLCECRKNEKCSDGIEGDGTCSCATEMVDDKCACNPGWSGENCDTFGENWTCTAVGQPCIDSSDCCFDGICMKSFSDGTTSCRETIIFGGEEIRRIAVSHDGSLVATSRMGAIRIHRTDNFKQVLRISRYVQPSTAVAFSPDGSLIAVNEGGGLTLRSMDDGSFLGSDYISYVQNLTFSPDGTMLAAAHNNGFTVYKVASKTLEPYFSDMPFGSELAWDTDSVSFSSDSSFLIAGAGPATHANNAIIYDLAEKKAFQEIPVDEYYLEAAFSSYRDMLATGGYPLEYGKTINIFKYKNDKWNFSYALDGPSDEIDSLSFNATDDFLAIGGRYRSYIYTLYDIHDPILTYGWEMKFSPDDKILVIGTERGTLAKYSLPTFGDYFSSDYNGSRHIQLSSDGKEAAFIKDSSSVVIIDPLSGNIKKEIPLPFTAFSKNCLFSHDLQKIVFFKTYDYKDGYVLYDLKEEKTIFELSADSYLSFSFSPDGKVLATCSGNEKGTISQYSVENGELINSIDLEETVSSFNFSPDGSIAAISSSGRNIILSTSDMKELFSLPKGNIAFFPDSSGIILTDQNISLFSTSDGSEIEDPRFNMSAETAQLSSDGKYLVTEKGIYQLDSGELQIFTTHYYGIKETGITSDNSFILTAGRDTLRVINATGILEPYEGDCSKDSECETGYFCSLKVKRCFVNIN